MGCGEVSIRATQEGSVNYNPAMRVVKYFTISEDASIDNINSDDYSLNIYTKDGYVVNGSLSQQYIEVYDVSGNCKYHGTDKKIHVGKGIVIVRVNGRSYKLVCK